MRRVEVCPRPQTSCAGSPVQRSQPSGKGHGRQTLVRQQPRNKRDGHPCLTRNNMQRRRWDSMVHSEEGSFTRSLPTSLSQHSPGAILERLFVKTSVPELFLLGNLEAHLLRVSEGRVKGPVAWASFPSRPSLSPRKSSNDRSDAQQQSCHPKPSSCPS